MCASTEFRVDVDVVADAVGLAQLRWRTVLYKLPSSSVAYSSADAPEMISISSVVMRAWRARL